MSKDPITSHPAYHEGFFDALDGEPLFDDHAPEYRAGWEAAHRSLQIMKDNGFTRRTKTEFSKTITVQKR